MKRTLIIFLILLYIILANGQENDSASVVEVADQEDTSAIVTRPTPRFEIGGILGEPTGISLKLWRNTIVASELAVAWSFTQAFHLTTASDPSV